MITLSKLAKLAHVSVSTASKAFSLSNEVSPQTREMIFRIAREQGCFKKFFNAKYPKYVIAVICAEYKSHFYTSPISLLQEELARHACEICVASTNFSPQIEADLLKYYTHYANVDGIIMIGGSIPLPAQRDIPIATVFHSNSSGSDIRISGAFEEAVTSVFSYFLDHGVTDIGFIGDRHTQGKYCLFNNTALSLGLDREQLPCVLSQERFEKGGYAAMEELIASGHLPRALICAYDYMAIGAIRCAINHGLRIPEDIAIVGMDDIPECSYLNPPLSSINSNMEEACHIIAQGMMQRLADPEYTLTAKVPAQLHIRQSAFLP